MRLYIGTYILWTTIVSLCYNNHLWCTCNIKSLKLPFDDVRLGVMLVLCLLPRINIKYYRLCSLGAFVAMSFLIISLYCERIYQQIKWLSVWKKTIYNLQFAHNNRIHSLINKYILLHLRRLLLLLIFRIISI